ncbi:tRNA (N6-threonylcarbamoyladenosine(37)-N6)-methyltransferase TrmO [Desulfocurvus sp.]|jgi:tRNA-Thr(GGU) m(6)t(6)A37 methyltransferase TsaA|uniref:tRNA (N6-threonylcarbamoyladenosine(37)-N6)-methyltransferase TrmO n=1 Tax=Desulfocurvus sp. TaxID=2871698 RepID=UPI0025C6A5B0|nr:tRNA (N6-threonylcarbamoyladenosine(37)-N6)-methyltransferase TrmO [Desulfocurvus sp.]MCK9239718.1 tRNA (N6-threonylcarbamoyladenosine(37)-N6)-methyltransferase TrmO [Desulfocurvus sp.]
MDITYRPIGHFQTPHKHIKGMPIQPTGAQGIKGTILVLPEFREGLKDIEGFSHLIVLYHLHRSRGPELTVLPFLDQTPRGVFATRSPLRPNPLGLSVMPLCAVTAEGLVLDNVDVLDGTPVIDIKPYVPDFDSRPAARAGWLEGRSGNAATHRGDERFAAREREEGGGPR